MNIEEEKKHLQEVEAFIKKYRWHETEFPLVKEKLLSEIKRCQDEKTENHEYIKNLLDTRDEEMVYYENALRRKSKNKRDIYCPDEFDSFIKNFLHDVHDGQNGLSHMG